MRKTFLFLLLLVIAGKSYAQHFRVLAFFTGKNDRAHVSFVQEANRWFPEMGRKYGFSYDTTSDWSRMTTETLSRYQVILFLDTRPELPVQRAAFETYMKNGGAWMGFHFAAFALTPSKYPQDWDWYHTTFLGSGEYKGNTWRPTSARLKIENHNHPATQGLPGIVVTTPNEWYSWKNNLRQNPNIDVLLSVDPSSFPLGTGPKPHEIWHEGDYPVVWTNRKFRMLYLNMGHNDIDYEHGTNKELSFTFASEDQNKLIINGLLWLGRTK
ncbi:ThuA domain-containing protein [Siphonobacter aquaeclarae]|uniref:Trehalose utilisation n=1 Tax=Siphonobacter aquaeclarae TaxID=563176 RepID=A0A1G9XQC8_9BACT|nr:ThuA domain-containing protein [Siphonobacter aquaeclarae]SDM98987.1 Trehalose utilisation [Siphonobacter aquaeclarae]